VFKNSLAIKRKVRFINGDKMTGKLETFDGNFVNRSPLANVGNIYV
jgi:sRNA-binding regulator protein Hfq